MAHNEQNDELTLWEKLPLFLVVAAQCLVVYRWYTGQLAPAWIVTCFGILAAAALDLVVVTTTMGRRAGRNGVWSWLTAAAAAIFSALVALDVYGAIAWDAWLHAAYPVVTFIYAQHLAQPRPTDAPSTHDATQLAHDAAHTTHATTVNVLQVAPDAPEVRTVRAFIRSRAQVLRTEQPGLSYSDLAQRLETSRDTVRRALDEVEELPAVEAA